MFVQELSPLMQEALKQPIAFMGGLFSGLLRLNLNDDPVRSWLNQQVGSYDPLHTGQNNGSSNGSGPQSITIE